MDLWQGDLPDFIEAARSHRLASGMARSYAQIYKRRPSEPEYKSWEQSLDAVARVADEAVTDDVGVLVEYHLPLSERRIDVMFFGRRRDGNAGSLLVELKRWTDASLEDKWARNVISGGVEHVHPSEQAFDYSAYLRDVHDAYADAEFGIQPCAYCHEMRATRGHSLLDPRFAGLLALSPLFLSGDEKRLGELLNDEVGLGDGVSLMHRVRSGTFRPSKGIVQSLDAVLRHDDEWHLLDEHLCALLRYGEEACCSPVT